MAVPAMAAVVNGMVDILIIIILRIYKTSRDVSFQIRIRNEQGFIGTYSCKAFVSASYLLINIAIDKMSQHSYATSVLGGALTGNAYEGRRQMHRDELLSFLRPLYKSLLHEIGYVAATPPDDGTVKSLHELMKRKADATGIDYTEDQETAKGFTFGLSLACVRLFSSQTLVSGCVLKRGLRWLTVSPRSCVSMITRSRFRLTQGSSHGLSYSSMIVSDDSARNSKAISDDSLQERINRRHFSERSLPS